MFISGTVVCCSTCKKQYHDDWKQTTEADMKIDNGSVKAVKIYITIDQNNVLFQHFIDNRDFLIHFNMKRIFFWF